MTDGAMLTEILASLEIPCDKCSFHGKLDALAAGLGISTEGRLLGDVLDDIAAKEGIQRDNRLYGAFIRKLYDYITNGEDVTLEGNPLVLANSMGRPLKECVVSWKPEQEGEGTPSPDNIRPISGRDSVSITRQEDELSMALTLPSTVYGGEVGADGAGQETWKLLTLDGTERWADNGTVESKKEQQWALYGVLKPCDGIFGVSSHFGNTKGSTAYPFNFVRIADTSVVFHVALDGPFATIDAWKAYLAAQHAAGTPVQVAYKLATPVPFSATGGGTIPTVKGTNTLLTDADTIKATYRCNVRAAEQELNALYTDLLNELEE